MSQDKKFLTYYSMSGGVSSTKDVTKSFELGCWGVTKPVMYGVTLDFVNNKDLYVGIKPCYKLTYSENYYLFTYFCPKMNVKSGDYLLEFGLTNYTKVYKRWYTSYGLAFQSAKEYNLIPSLSFGVNYVY